MSSWRRLKKQIKLKKRLRRAGLVLTVTIAVLLTLGAIYLWNFLAQPFASAGGTFQDETSWDGASPFNLLLIEVSDVNQAAPPTRYLGVASLNPTQEGFAIVSLPNDYRNLRDLYGLGNLSGEGEGLARIASTVASLLGVPIDGYLLVGSEGIEQSRGLFPRAVQVKDFIQLTSIPRIPAVWGIARENLRTDLSVAEVGRILWYLFSIRSDKIGQIELTKELLDAPSTLDRRISPIFRDEKLVAEHLKIQVLNGTGEPGLATASARVIRNIGGEVVRVDNFERQDLVKGYLLMESSGSYTAKRLAQIFGVSDSRPPRTGAEARANITLILGAEDFFRAD